MQSSSHTGATLTFESLFLEDFTGGPITTDASSKVLLNVPPVRRMRSLRSRGRGWLAELTKIGPTEDSKSHLPRPLGLCRSNRRSYREKKRFFFILQIWMFLVVAPVEQRPLLPHRVLPWLPKCNEICVTKQIDDYENTLFH